MAKTTVPGLYIADGAITAAKLSSTLDLSGVTITVATASTGDSDTSVASTAFVQQEIAALVDSSPSALNTLNELAAAIGDDASFSTTVTNSIATKLPLAGGTLTGNLIINTTGSIQIPVGTTAQRPTAAQGQLRFNTTTSKPEIYSGSAWTDVGGGVESVNSATGVVVLTTANIAENTNLYYTDARADARIAAADTDDLSEGSTNLYFTTARANSAFDGRLSGSTGVTVSNGAVSIGQDVATSTSPTFQNLTLSGTNSIKVPSGTTAQRSGSPANGMLRYNSSTNEFEGYADSAWGAIGGDTTSSVDLYTATGNGSTATYDTGKNPQSENNTWVFVGGVYQPKSTYSFSGTQITLSENLPNGEDLEVITGTVSTYNPTDAILGQYNVTTSNTASYNTSLTTENENNVFVFVDGVYQPKSSYTYSGSTLTLDAVPTSGMSLEVLVTRSMNAATVTTGFLADDAVTTVKILDANVTAGKLASSLDLTGKTVTVATASAGDNDTSVASTAFVRQEITSLVDSAPAAMDTLNELADALGGDENFSTTVNASIAAKLPLAGGTMTGDLILGDNVKLEVGSAVGGDLQIYHDGNNSIIDDAGTGSLFIRGTNINIQNLDADPDENMITTVAGGAVTLYHSGTAKLSTTSAGITVAGTSDLNGSVTIGTSLTTLLSGNDIDFQRAGDSYLSQTGGGSLFIRTNDGSSNKVRLNVSPIGDISFYEDAGSTAKFFWDASAESLGIGTTTPTMGKLQVHGSKYVNTNSGKALGGIHVSPDSAATLGQFGGAISFSAGGNGSSAIAAVNDGGTDNDSTGLAFFVHSTGTGSADATEVVRIDELGNVGIGTNSPNTTVGKVDIAGLANNYNTAPMITFRDTVGTTDSRNWSIGNLAINYGDFHIGVGDSNSDYFDAASHSKFMIDKDGNVGIGTSTPTADLSVGSTTTSSGDVHLRTTKTTFSITPSNTNAGGILLDVGFVSGGQGPMKFGIGGSEKMHILSSGNLVVGDTSQIGTLPTGSKLNIFGDGVTLRLDGSSNATKSILFRGTSVGNPGEIQADGGLRFRTEDANTRITFHTNSTGSNNERMRIDEKGNVQVGDPTNLTSANTSASIVQVGVPRLTVGSAASMTMAIYDVNTELSHTAGSAVTDAKGSKGTVWRTTSGQIYGPYIDLPRGQYRVSYRIKCNDNTSYENAVRLMVYAVTNGVVNTRHTERYITCREFETTTEYQTFSIDIDVNSDMTNTFEIYGFSQNSNQIDWDYVTITPETDSYSQRQRGIITKPNQPAFRASGNGSWQTTNNSSPQIPFNVAVVNVGGHYSASNKEFTAPVAGMYFFSWHTYNDSGYSNSITPRINGTALDGGGGDGLIAFNANGITGNITVSASFIHPLAVGDTVDLACRVNHTTRTYMGHSQFMGYLIG